MTVLVLLFVPMVNLVLSILHCFSAYFGSTSVLYGLLSFMVSWLILNQHLWCLLLQISLGSNFEL